MKSNYRRLRVECLEPRRMFAGPGMWLTMSPPALSVVGEKAIGGATIHGMVDGEEKDYSATVDWISPTHVDTSHSASIGVTSVRDNSGQGVITTYSVKDSFTPDMSGGWILKVTLTPFDPNGNPISGSEPFTVNTPTTIDSNTTFTASTLPDPSTNLVVTNDAILDLGGNTVVVNSLYLDNGASVVDGSLTCTTLCQVSSGTISANLAGGPLTVIRGDTAVLSGNNTYSGTDVESGTLQAAS